MKKTILIIIVLVALLAGGLWYWQIFSLSRFNDAYRAYAELAAKQQNAAFIPGAASNPLRAQLNQMLERVLSPGTKAKDRLVFAQQGLDLIIQSNAEVDAIGEVAPDVQNAADNLEHVANSLGNTLRKVELLAIVALAKQELYTIQDIRGLSYRANFETAEVFNRIITDQGVLTDSYVKDLNSQLPDAEKAFNKRQNSYTDLQKQMYDIQHGFLAIK